MAIASKKKAKKAPRTAGNKKASPRKAKAVAKKSKQPAAKARPSGKAAPAKKRIQEPERSAPAMAEVDGDVLEFIAAIDDFKKQHGRPFPSWSEVLLIVRQLGYRRG